jgi:hypothetical protein
MPIEWYHSCPATLLSVMAGLDPAIQPLAKNWIAGSSPAMTVG